MHNLVFQELDRLEQTLATVPMLRLRVVCPSQEFSQEEMQHGVGRWLSGSRGLWESLTLGTQTDLAIIAIQAPPVGSRVVEHLFGLLGAAVARDATRRHALVELDDSRPLHLSEKLLANGAVLDRLRSTIAVARKLGHRVEGVSCYATSPRMADVAQALGVSLVDTQPEHLRWGTKSGSRGIFRQAGVPHLAGTYSPVYSQTDIIDAARSVTQGAEDGVVMVKVDHGFGSGHGNAVLTLPAVSGNGPLRAETLARVWQPCAPGISPQDFLRRVAANGAIVEKFVRPQPCQVISFPSALAYLDPSRGPGGVSLLAIHDQVLGPAGDYVACRFPAHPAYRDSVATLSRAVLDRLARRGVSGHIGVDFIVTGTAEKPEVWDIYATEINMRQTGSTHPHRTARAVLDADWHADGTSAAHGDQPVHYKGTDSIISERYVGLPAETLITAIEAEPALAYSRGTGRGVIPHLWSALEPFGKIGATIIGSSAADCDRLEQRFVGLIERLAAR